MHPFRWRCPACHEIGFFLQHKPEPGNEVFLQDIFYSDPYKRPQGIPACEQCGVVSLQGVLRTAGGFIAFDDFLRSVEENRG
jgi:hypothetical protein